MTEPNMALLALLEKRRTRGSRGLSRRRLPRELGAGRCSGDLPQPAGGPALIGAVLVEQQDEWEAGRRYSSLTSMAALYRTQNEPGAPYRGSGRDVSGAVQALEGTLLHHLTGHDRLLLGLK